MFSACSVNSCSVFNINFIASDIVPCLVIDGLIILVAQWPLGCQIRRGEETLGHSVHQSRTVIQRQSTKYFIAFVQFLALAADFLHAIQRVKPVNKWPVVE